MQDRDLIRFNVLRNALYHQGRRRTLERWNRWMNFAIILLGAAAIGDLLSTLSLSQVWVGVGVSVIGALQLVFDLGRSARDHQALSRDYFALLAEIEEVPEAGAEDLARWNARWIRITADEPPCLRARDAQAYNDAVGALEWPRTERLHIPLHHRVFGGIFPFDGHDYTKRSEIG